MASFDADTIKAGTPSLELMERAAKKVFDSFYTFLEEKYLNTSVLILAGTGNNGGDGIAVARLCYEHKINAQVILVNNERYSNDLQEQIKALDARLKQDDQYISDYLFLWGDCNSNPLQEDLPISIIEQSKLDELLSSNLLLLDALLGTGIQSAPRGNIASLIEVVNNFHEDLPIISIDLPSGVNADTGEVYEPHINACHTVVIECVKRGLLQFPARSVAGEIEVASIGIGCEAGCAYKLLRYDTVQKLPKRSLDAHKGNFGKVLVLGGSSKMPGAPALASMAAQSYGAGRVYMTTFPSSVSFDLAPEIIHLPMKAERFVGSDECIEKILNEINEAGVLLIGPGIGQEEETREFFKRLISHLLANPKPAILDADALNILAQIKDGDSKFILSDDFILTPHPGEAATLLGCSAADVQRDRYSAAEKLVKSFNCNVVLKGAGTIVRSTDRGMVSDIANPYMATAGSGDVLAGLISALLAQGLKPYDAACLGVYIHSQAGKMQQENRPGPMLASNLICYFPELVYQMTEGN